MCIEDVLSEIDTHKERIRNLALQWVDEEFSSDRMFRQMFGFYRCPREPYSNEIKFDEFTLNLLQQHSGVPMKELLERAAQCVARRINNHFGEERESFQAEVVKHQSSHNECQDALHYHLRLRNLAALRLIAAQ